MNTPFVLLDVDQTVFVILVDWGHSLLRLVDKVGQRYHTPASIIKIQEFIRTSRQYPQCVFQPKVSAIQISGLDGLKNNTHFSLGPNGYKTFLELL